MLRLPSRAFVTELPQVVFKEPMKPGYVLASTDCIGLVVARSTDLDEFLGSTDFRDALSHGDGRDPIISAVEDEQWGAELLGTTHVVERKTYQRRWQITVVPFGHFSRRTQGRV